MEAGPHTNSGSAETELAKERTFGGYGHDVERDIRCIDLSGGADRQDELDDEIWTAATDMGFFQVTGHGIPQQQIDTAFELAAAFFDLPADTKQRWPLRSGTNSGWEFRAQKRPSTGTLDQKESYQITTSRMERLALWPSDDELAGFRSTMEAFERANWSLAMQLLGSFAAQARIRRRLLHASPRPGLAGVPEHAPSPALPPDGASRTSTNASGEPVRTPTTTASRSCISVPASTACSCVRVPMRPQRDDPNAPLGWTSVEPTPGTITCNIGDMLMRWSDGRLPSTLHRVRMPRPDEYLGPRYSMAFFAQANCDAVIVGPSGGSAPITAADYLQQRIAANFAP